MVLPGRAATVALRSERRDVARLPHLLPIYSGIAARPLILEWRNHMGRIVGAVIAGYVVIVAAIFLSFTLAFLLIGSESAFQPGSWSVSGAWVTISIILGLLAALLGGWVAGYIARRPAGPNALAGVVLFLGLLVAVTASPPPPPGEDGVRAGSVRSMEAMRRGRAPPWLAWVNPLIGAAGVLIGGRLRRTGHATSPP
jgi:hypothetical protein